MEKHFFRYQILRHIADLRRMETENFGVIAQSTDAVSCRFKTSLGARHGFDYENYQKWRNFLKTEIEGPAVPFFQPNRTGIEFLKYLQERCVGNYSLTRPLELVLETSSLKEAEDYLFRTLVLKPDDAVKTIKQPVQRLRKELDERGVLSHPAFHSRDIFKAAGLNELVGYYYIRNHGVNLPVIIQPVQNRLDPTVTSNQMERAEAMVINFQKAKVRSEISVVVDDIPEPKPKDSDVKKWTFDRVQEGKQNLIALGANVVDSTQQTVRLAASIEKDIEEIETSPPQKEMSYS